MQPDGCAHDSIGQRALTVHAIDATGEDVIGVQAETLNIEIIENPQEPEIDLDAEYTPELYQAYFSADTAGVNQMFSVVVVVSQNTGIVKLTNENGIILGKSNQEIMNIAGDRVVMFDTNIGSKGNRVIKVEVQGPDGVYIDDFISVNIVIQSAAAGVTPKLF